MLELRIDDFKLASAEKYKYSRKPIIVKKVPAIKNANQPSEYMILGSSELIKLDGIYISWNLEKRKNVKYRIYTKHNM